MMQQFLTSSGLSDALSVVGEDGGKKQVTLHSGHTVSPGQEVRDGQTHCLDICEPGSLYKAKVV